MQLQSSGTEAGSLRCAERIDAWRPHA
jgi:hypothetical protein